MNDDNSKANDPTTDKFNQVIKLINNCVAEYRDTTSQTAVGIDLNGGDVSKVFLLFYACKRLADLQKELPNLFDQKIFMEGVLIPSITHKDLKQFLYSRFDSVQEALAAGDTPENLAKFLGVKSISSAIFDLIKEKTNKLLAVDLNELFTADSTRPPLLSDSDTVKTFQGFNEYIFHKVISFLTSTLTWEEIKLFSLEHEEITEEELLTHDPVGDGPIFNRENSFDHIVHILNNYISGWGVDLGWSFKTVSAGGIGILGEPAENKLEEQLKITKTLSKENLEFQNLRLDKFKKKEIFEIMSALDFSTSSCSRYDFDHRTLGILHSLVAELESKNGLFMGDVSNREIRNHRVETRIRDLALSLLGHKPSGPMKSFKKHRILFRGLSSFKYFYERGGLGFPFSKNIFTPSLDTEQKINKKLRTARSDVKTKIIFNTSNPINELRLLLLGLPVSQKTNPNSLNKQLDTPLEVRTQGVVYASEKTTPFHDSTKDRSTYDNSVLNPKGKIIHYSFPQALENSSALNVTFQESSTYESLADIVLHELPDERIPTWKDENFPDFIYEDALGLSKPGTRGKKITILNSIVTANILSSIKQLNKKKGKLGLIVNESFLSTGKNRSIRKYLIEKDLIEMVVGIGFPDFKIHRAGWYDPGNTDFSGAYAQEIYSDEYDIFNLSKDRKKQAIIIINLDKAPERKNKILFGHFDFPGDYADYNYWDDIGKTILKGYESFSPSEINKNIEEKARFEALGEKWKPLPKLRLATRDDIRYVHYNIKPERHFISALSIFESLNASKTHTLGEICNIDTGTNIPTKFTLNARMMNVGEENPGWLSIVKGDFLRKFKYGEELSVDFFINHQKFIRADTFKKLAPRYKLGLISEKCILVNLYSKSFQPIIFDPENIFSESIFVDPAESVKRGILIGQNVAAIRIKEEYKDKIEFNFLVHCAFEQIHHLHFLGNLNTNQRISIENLKASPLRIIETFESQKSSARQVILDEIKIDEIAAEEREIKQEVIEIKDKAEFELSSFINHEGGRKIQRINTKVKGFLNFIKDHGLEDEPFQKEVSDSQTITSALNDALQSSKQLQELLKNLSAFCKGEIKPEDLSLVDVESLIRKTILPLANDGEFLINLKCNASNKNIYLEENYFINSIENLINNAKEHGYEGLSISPVIDFEISDKDNGIIIDYKNNGNPLPVEITEDMFLRLGMKGKNSKGYGMGGAFIKKMLEGHSADFKIIRGDDVEGVHIRLIFPNNKISS
jgi:hypothetical protein